MSEFYVGWEPKAPPGIARLLRGLTAVLIVGSAFVAGWLAAAQSGFDRAAFEFGRNRTLTGIVIEHPFPHLLVERPEVPGRPAGYSRYLLSGPGKHGAQALVAGLNGQLVEARGELIYRADQTMFKLGSERPHVLPNQDHRFVGLQAELGVGEVQGSVTLRGEIVDPQCYYGIMRPGHGKPHRACAVRCLAGGLPPVLHVPEDSTYYLVVGADGTALGPELLAWVADPVEINGTAYRHGTLHVLRADPDSIRLLD